MKLNELVEKMMSNQEIIVLRNWSIIYDGSVYQLQYTPSKDDVDLSCQVNSVSSTTKNQIIIIVR